jgi:hypothetical protein
VVIRAADTENGRARVVRKDRAALSREKKKAEPVEE